MLDIALVLRVIFKLEYVVHFKEKTAPEAIDATNAVAARDGIVAELRRGAEPAGA